MPAQSKLFIMYCFWQFLGKTSIFGCRPVDKALYFAWCSLILNWPRNMFSKCVCYDFFNRRHKRRKEECFESLGWQNECFESQIECFKSSDWYFPSFPCSPCSPKYSMLSHLRWQDSNTWRALPVEEPPKACFRVNDLPAAVSGEWMGTRLKCQKYGLLKLDECPIQSNSMVLGSPE